MRRPPVRLCLLGRVRLRPGFQVPFIIVIMPGSVQPCVWCILSKESILSVKRKSPNSERLPCGPVEVEFYSGYQEGETPRAVVLAGRRFLVTDVRGRKRVRDSGSVKTAEVFDCALDDGRSVVITRDEEGRSSVRFVQR